MNPTTDPLLLPAEFRGLTGFCTAYATDYRSAALRQFKGEGARIQMIVYLIHFDRPIGDLSNPRGQAQHYIGCTDDLEARLYAHRSGNGSRLLAAVTQAGIEWRVVTTWEGGRDLERHLKRQKNAPRFCPICNQKETNEGGNIQ